MLVVVAAVVVAAVAVAWLYGDALKINLMVFLIIQRGLLSPSCFWWTLSDALLTDASGVDLFYDMKRSNRGRSAIPMAMFGTPMYLVVDPRLIRTVLDNSPRLFGVGKLKRQFFSSFMPGNVGVAQDDEWAILRRQNEIVLGTDPSPTDVPTHDRWVRWLCEALRRRAPLDFTDFSALAVEMATKIVFGPNARIEPRVWRIFDEASSVAYFWTGQNEISDETMRAYDEYLDAAIADPEPCSLVWAAARTDATSSQIKQQIPHWMFPISGLFAVSLPRLLLLATSHREAIGGTSWRSRILETLRLNNPVVTTFRTLREPFAFDGENYDPGDQFLILNNPVLRDPRVFPSPDRYVPQRWNDDLEASYYSIMFVQGPQKCPGRNIVLFLLEEAAKRIAPGLRAVYPTGLGPGAPVPQMMNPCTIRFNERAKFRRDSHRPQSKW